MDWQSYQKHDIVLPDNVTGELLWTGKVKDWTLIETKEWSNVTSNSRAFINKSGTNFELTFSDNSASIALCIDPQVPGTRFDSKKDSSDIIKALYITCPLISLAFVTVVIACVLYRKRRTFLRVSKHNMSSPATNVCSGATGTNYAECSNIGVLGKQQERVIKEMSREAALPLSEIETAQGIGLSSQDTVIHVDDTDYNKFSDEVSDTYTGTQKKLNCFIL